MEIGFVIENKKEVKHLTLFSSNTNWLSMKKFLFSISIGYTIFLCSYSNTHFIVSDIGAIHGQVLDRNTGDPIPFAKVFMVANESRTITANDLGQFSFIDLEEGDYLLSASSDNYLTDFVNVKVSGDEAVEANIEMGNNSSLPGKKGLVVN